MKEKTAKKEYNTMEDLKINFLHRFLKEHGITLKHFLEESTSTRQTQKFATKKCFKEYLILCPMYSKSFGHIIDRMLVWSDTNESWDFWYELNHNFIIEYRRNFATYAKRKQ